MSGDYLVRCGTSHPLVDVRPITKALDERIGATEGGFATCWGVCFVTTVGMRWTKKPTVEQALIREVRRVFDEIHPGVVEHVSVLDIEAAQGWVGWCHEDPPAPTE